VHRSSFGALILARKIHPVSQAKDVDPDGTRDLTFITHPFYDLSEWEQYVHTLSKDNRSEYTEPFVVIQNSESPNFEEYEQLTFTEADRKFKEVESAERELRVTEGKTGGYHKTNGVIFYKESPDDTELSTYEFRYDIGDYSADRSGLYNHVNSFWATAQERIDSNEYSGFTREEIAGIRNGLIPLLAQHQYVPEPPQPPLQADESSKEAMIAEEAAELTQEPAPPTSPPPVFFVDWDKAQFDFDLKLYKDRDVIGYNRDGVESKLGRMLNWQPISPINSPMGI
jgi:hypothetical protein